MHCPVALKRAIELYINDNGSIAALKDSVTII
jgi:hypothetical protein